jgi:hypothetical protein
MPGQPGCDRRAPRELQKTDFNGVHLGEARLMTLRPAIYHVLDART